MASMDLLLTRLLAVVKYGKWVPTDVVNLFITLTKKYKTLTGYDILQMSKTLYQIEFHKINKSDLNDKRDIEKAVQEIAENTKEKELKEIIEEIRKQDVDENILADVKDIVSCVHSWCSDKPPAVPQLNSALIQPKDKKEMLFKLCMAVKKTKNWFPKRTQMVTWSILVLSRCSRLVQVGTGEGKSCIVAMFAAYCAMIGESVDIISSSPVLAERDAEEWKSFYKDLKITVDVNTNKQRDQDLKKCYDCQVVYGTTQSFAGDWLRQRFHRRNVRPKRTFQHAIVDEVDSLVLDKGLEVVYLNSEMPIMKALNVILAEIWFVVNQLEHLDTGKTLGLVQPFSQLLSENLRSDTGLDERSILQLAEDSGLTPTGSTRNIREESHKLLQQLEVVLFFRKFEEIYPQYKFKLYYQKDDGKLQEFSDTGGTDAIKKQELHILVLQSGLCRLVFLDERALHRSLEQRIKTGLISGIQSKQGECCIPDFLEHINGKLQTWIENAIHAKEMTLGHEYILHEDCVSPVDYDSTGVVQNDMEWGDGLHQFLEMKHLTRLTDMSIITNFKSNVSLFQSYKHIYGVTGTLGNTTELDMLQKLYPGIKTCTIPSFKPRKIYEEDGMVINVEDEWVQKICTVVKTQVSPAVYRGPRAALVICETINRAETIHRALRRSISTANLKVYTNNNMDNSRVMDKDVNAGDVIIATNLAGRGTDLKVCGEVNKAGGLFVIQTFLPVNIRVENQAFGRTARQGNPGSSQLIVCSSHFSDLLKHVMAIQTPFLSFLLTCFLSVTSTALASELIKNKITFAFEAYKKDPNNQNCEAMASALKEFLVIQQPKGPTILDVAKEARDTMVQIRLSRFLEKDIPKILKKEKLFSLYLDTLDNTYKQRRSPTNHEDIVSSLHECWGMWLLMKFRDDEPTETLQQTLKKDLESALKKLQSKESPSSMVYHYIRSGNRLRHQGKLVESIEMYTRAAEDPCWVGIALYNRALSILRKRDTGYIKQALADLKKAEKHVDAYLKELDLTFKFVISSSKAPNVHNSYFSEQFKGKYLTQEILKFNINEALKTLRIADSRRGDVRVTEKSVAFLMQVSHPLLQIYAQICALEMKTELLNLISLGLDTIISLEERFSFAGLLTKMFRDL